MPRGDATPTGWPRCDGGTESVTERFREVLTPPPIHEVAITELDHLGVPTWTAAQWRTDGSVASSSGYGATRASARTGTLGELAERVVREQLPELTRRHGSYSRLRESVPTLDPRRLRLPVGSTYAPDDRLTWVEATRYPSGDPLWVPVEAVATTPEDVSKRKRDEEGLLFTPITNGMGAGESFERAFVHGLLELVQRDGNSVAYRATDRGIRLDVDADQLDDPVIVETLDRFDEEGLDIQVKLADTVFGIPSLYVVGAEHDPAAVPQPLMLTGCGEGAHPDREVALRKALLEFAASRARKRFYHGSLADVRAHCPAAYLGRLTASPPSKGEFRAFDAMREWTRLDATELYERIEDPVFRVAERRPFSDVRSVEPGSIDGPDALLSLVAERFEAADMELAYVDLSPAPDVSVVRAIVPGTEVETMSYHRIGPRNIDRLTRWAAANTSEMAGIGRPPETAERVPLAPEDESRLDGPAWFDPSVARDAVDGLYPLYREPPRHAVALHAPED
jgi:ribosomal protein S12 methylthiotransferase accessory factor